MRSKRKGIAGVTLIELLVALALVGVVLSAAGTMLLQAYANEEAYRSQNEAQANARAAADTVTDDLRGIVKNAMPASPPANPVQGARLIFEIYDDAGAQETVSYWRDTTNNNLYRQLQGRGAVVIAQNITGFAFSYGNGNKFADVAVTAATGTPPDQSSVTVQARTALRNYLP